MGFSIKSKLLSLFGAGTVGEEFYEEIEDLLIEGDFGAKNAMKISDAVRECKPDSKEEVLKVFRNYLDDSIKGISLNPDKNELSVYLILGVNGVGKTTSIAKLAKYYTDKGVKTIVAAADTFRAAAIDQLSLHAKKLGVRIIKQDNGSDPGAVIYDAISSAESKKDNLILCDTAGRMHNKEDLLRELQKIDKIVTSRVKPENYKKILVIDATTGQNSVSQAEIFNNAVKLDALILTKYDSTSKAGALSQIPIPVAFIGNGEAYSDIAEFDKEKFINNLLSV